ncbi:MAG: VTT domain-containing protein [Candidatus Diapherotrites archaeon]|uniref:VTT domain-containing protein n=1 Tax=Candidatus Iainarchaeum sp. TaxID=3101447 RepID=A0A8T3YJR4_9ARCH|nr:VTT domain-containing protein [Candidatus Diapherotrites archaeon]
MFDLFGKVQDLLLGFGYTALFAIVFAESGLFFGFFLPGDSLLFTAGLMASQGLFDVKIVLVGVAVSAILGDQVGYWMGSKFGRGFFNRPDSIFFNPRHIEDAEAFYARHGKKTIVLARFVPAVRTFAPIVAGMAHMDYRTFVSYNVLGGVLWSVVFVLAGYFLGRAFPESGNLIAYIVIAIVLVTTVPIVMEFLKRLKNRGGR